MAGNDKWYFSKEQLENTPSRKCGYDSLKELSYRQQAANFIQEMGQRLKVTQLCINTAIVYMHRFYVFHSFTNFTWHQMASAALFLAAKVEELPRKLEYVIRVANVCRNPKDTSLDLNSEKYLAQSQDLVFNENVLLQTLGFDVAIDHPHTHVVRCCQLVRATKDLAQTSYFMASNSLHLTTMCLRYKPTVVACFCIHLACKWSNWEIPLSNEQKEWFSYVDPTVTSELLQQLTQEFLVIFERCPSRLKEKIMAIGDIPHTPGNHMNSPFDTDPKKIEGKDAHGHRTQHEGKSDDPHKYNRSSRPHESNSIREREYREKKEKERLAAQQQQQHGTKPSTSSNSNQKMPQNAHHRHPVDPNKYKSSSSSSSHSRPSSSGAAPIQPYPQARVEPRDILREATRDSSFGLPHNRDSHHGKDIVRESQVRSEKEKRDYLLKHNMSNDTNNPVSKYPSGYAPEKHRSSADQNRLPRLPEDNKVPPNKHEQVRRTHEEMKPFIKNEAENVKKHLNVSAFNQKPSHTTSQKVMSDPMKTSSVPKQSSSHARSHHHNGNNGGPYNSMYSNPNLNIETDKSKIQHKQEMKEEIPIPAIVKRPSLFSPEKTPPQQHSTSLKTHSTIKKEDLKSPSTAPISIMSIGQSPMGSGRTRNYSSSSEPELRPVMKKIDQMEGFENILKNTSIGIKVSQSLNAVKDEKPLVGAQAPVLNGMETNPTLISNLLKETTSIPQLATKQEVVVSNNEEVKKEKEHHHKSKKKNKEKHKHKDKEREKKKKHKDKDREKHKHKDRQNDIVADVSNNQLEPKPLVIKIQKDKIHSLPPEISVPSPSSLKIKIPKDKIKTENVGEISQPVVQPTSLGGLKIKISKEVINSCNTGESNSRKREKERTSHDGGPPAKMSKSSSKDKPNGRHSYGKVHLGDSELSQNRLAESKYTKTSSS